MPYSLYFLKTQLLFKKIHRDTHTKKRKRKKKREEKKTEAKGVRSAFNFIVIPLKPQMQMDLEMDATESLSYVCAPKNIK